MQMQQLLYMRELGVPVPTDLLIQNSTLQNKQELIDAIGKSEQQQQQQAQEQQAIQMEVLKAQIEDLKSRAMANEGLGVERASRVTENQALAVERIAEAEKDRSLGALDMVKAAKELDGVDLTHLQQAIDIINAIKERNEAKAEESAKKEVKPQKVAKKTK